MKYLFVFFACLLLVACAKGQGISLLPYHDPHATPYDFELCHGFGCSYKTQIALSEAEWKRAVKPFRKKPKSAKKEREKIVLAISRIEKAVQKSSGMRADLGQAKTFEKDQDQMDCLDETINSSRFLAFIEKEGLLRYHKVSDPVHRGYFVDGMWPHNSAAIKDLKTDQVFAVDSYYSDNGGDVYVVGLDEWLDEWRPDWAIVPPKPQRKPKWRT